MAISSTYGISPASGPLREAIAATTRPELDFAAVYDSHFSFVFRTVRRLGVHPSSIEDVVQEIFLVVHRRLAEFEGRSSIKTWIFGIAVRLVRDHRRTARRKRLGADARSDADLDTLRDDGVGPHEAAENVEAARILEAILDRLDDEKREVFVLVELEEMTVPDVAEVLSANTNTIYSRLRAARREFEAALARFRAREESRTPGSRTR